MRGGRVKIERQVTHSHSSIFKCPMMRRIVRLVLSGLVHNEDFNKVKHEWYIPSEWGYEHGDGLKHVGKDDADMKDTQAERISFRV